MPQGMGTYGSKRGRPPEKKAGGGSFKAVPAGNTGLAKLPTEVRNKMGFKRDGGMMYGKKKMMGGGSVNENINPYGRPADTSLT